MLRYTRNAILSAAALSALVTLVLPENAALAQSEADKEKAMDEYKKGTIEYNLGNWSAAIKHFERAFKLLPDAAFLFNIAQTHRQSGDCQKAIFFYGRYLSLRPDANNAEEVRGFISELENGCPAPEPKGDQPDPDDKGGDAIKKSSDTGKGATVKTGSGGAVKGASTGTPADDSSFLQIRGAAGTAVLFAGSELETPPQASFTLGIGYPMQLGPLDLDLGVLGSFAPVSWEQNDASGTTSLMGLMANVGVSKGIVSSLRARGEVGAGVMLISGLEEEQNVFTEEGMVADGVLSAFSLRAALGLEYELSSSLAIAAQPLIFSFAPAPTGLRESISSVSSYQAQLGLRLSL